VVPGTRGSLLQTCAKHPFHARLITIPRYRYITFPRNAWHIHACPVNQLADVNVFRSCLLVPPGGRRGASDEGPCSSSQSPLVDLCVCASSALRSPMLRPSRLLCSRLIALLVPLYLWSLVPPPSQGRAVWSGIIYASLILQLPQFSTGNQDVLWFCFFCCSIRALHSGLLSLLKFAQARLSSLSRSLWKASRPSGVELAPLSVASSADSVRVHLISLSR